MHHHGPLAGVSAGAAAVLFAFGALALAWHRVAAQVSLAIAVLAYAVIIALALILAIGTWLAFLWVRHRARNPELLASGRAVRAEVLTPPSGAAAQLAAWRPAAIDPPRASGDAITERNDHGTVRQAGESHRPVHWPEQARQVHDP